jgi:serine/threonine-protein kinase
VNQSKAVEQTLAYEQGAPLANPQIEATVARTKTVQVTAVDLDATGQALAQTLAAEGAEHAVATLAASATIVRKTSTVLPEIQDDGTTVSLVPRNRVRYAELKKLGEGGMGEVALALDEDIGRNVAVKRLHPESLTSTGMARFVDEVHVVGQLEHPNIVPIHDVGVDDQGRYFFVMKYVEGETIEQIIEKLRAKDPEYVRKYTIEARVELFMGILHALQYAHAHGIVHRDLKPANVMVGKFGEVVLMDWGIAKPLKNKRDFVSESGQENAANDTMSAKARLFTTRHGSLLGTPAYMAPEQARGRIDLIDERSDLYSAVVMLHELLGLKHYLHDKQNIASMLHAVMEESAADACQMPFFHDAPLGPPPVEYLYICNQGLQKDPKDRFQSVAELTEALQAAIEGRFQVHCHVGMTKRMAREFGRFVDRKPQMAFTTMVVGALLFLLSFAVAMRSMIA